MMHFTEACTKMFLIDVFFLNIHSSQKYARTILPIYLWHCLNFTNIFVNDSINQSVDKIIMKQSIGDKSWVVEKWLRLYVNFHGFFILWKIYQQRHHLPGDQCIIICITACMSRVVPMWNKLNTNSYLSVCTGAPGRPCNLKLNVSLQENCLSSNGMVDSMWRGKLTSKELNWLNKLIQSLNS